MIRKAQLGWKTRRCLMLVEMLRVSVGVPGASWKEGSIRQGLVWCSPAASLSWNSPSVAGSQAVCSHAVFCRTGTWAVHQSPPKPWQAYSCFVLIVPIQPIQVLSHTHTHTHEFLFLSLLHSVPVSAVLWGLGLVGLSCDALAECYWMVFFRPCAQCYS